MIIDGDLLAVEGGIDVRVAQQGSRQSLGDEIGQRQADALLLQRGIEALTDGKHLLAVDVDGGRPDGASLTHVDFYT